MHRNRKHEQSAAHFLCENERDDDQMKRLSRKMNIYLFFPRREKKATLVSLKLNVVIIGGNSRAEMHMFLLMINIGTGCSSSAVAVTTAFCTLLKYSLLARRGRKSQRREIKYLEFDGVRWNLSVG